MVTNKFRVCALAACASLTLASTPSTAQLAGSASAGSGVPAAAGVTAFYNQWSKQPIWFRNGQADPAVSQLIAILKRAPFDGFAAGPQLAAQVEAAAAQASTGQPEAIASADRVLSSAWVDYVQAIKRPTQGMTYVYPVLQPQGSRADQILLTAAAAAGRTTALGAPAHLN
jgi:hypothetical protein